MDSTKRYGRFSEGSNPSESTMKETIKNTTNSSIYKKFVIKKIIKNNHACLICIKRRSGSIRKKKL